MNDDNLLTRLRQRHDVLIECVLQILGGVLMMCAVGFVFWSIANSIK